MTNQLLAEEVDRLRSQNLRLARRCIEYANFINSIFACQDKSMLEEKDFKIKLIREETQNVVK